MFVGRTGLVSLVEQLVLVDGTPPVPVGRDRPVLVVEGYGGSGRTEFLHTQWSRWKADTPTVWVDARLVDDPESHSLRPLLVAVMQGLSEKVGGYEVKFPRVVLAHIAMESPVPDVDPERAKQTMRRRLIEYRDRDALITLVGSLLGTSLGAVTPNVPGADVVADTVAQAIVDRLRRASKLAKFTWDESLAWFGHQDNRLRFDPVAALVQLSRQAAIDTADVRGDVDDLLVAALLADVRESLARVAGRPWNALVLLDEGDVPTARSFIAALLRMRRSRANRSPDPSTTPVDPLVVVTTSGGRLAADLPGRDEARPSWLAIDLGELTEQDVHDMARAHIWPPELGTRRVADAVYRLTGGHAAATDLVLRALETAPGLVDRVDEVLGRPGTTASLTVEEELLGRIVKGLGPGDDVGEHLVTLSAARDRTEAGKLRELLDHPPGLDLMMSTTLWSGRSPQGLPALPRFIRYLGLRALAARSDGQDWVTVFTALRDQALADGDHAGRLHHELALGDTALVAAELGELLPDLADEEWLALLDGITATPRLVAEPQSAAVDGRDLVRRLIGTLHALGDPRLSERKALCRRYLLAENDFRTLAGSSEAFLLRAQHYHRLAERLC
ncbi:hypothetical protein FHS29_006793 [Saccharothrix tamanrassetensis]|uniref:Uncharacterized protein n=1 Tax=Saccharothrix tamanrassetensis TaxID=1051531 RepID=A0A841CSD3_9PSEU|nr:hypothetical protein [Saccharothrix tamanrassetensis]MBB5960170.1 hypothetical protein [Saccharothrix tamanrassetensis]